MLEQRNKEEMRERLSATDFSFSTDETAVYEWDLHSEGDSVTLCFDTARMDSMCEFHALPIFYDDLEGKAFHILNNDVIKTVFIRFLFSGEWVPELVQVLKNTASTSTIISPEASSFSHEGLSFFFRDHLLHQTNTAVSHSRGVSFMLHHSPPDMDIAILISVALALQVFCRSELFLHLSEQQWSSESIRGVEWQDYARESRADITRQYIRTCETTNGNEQCNNDSQYCMSESNKTVKQGDVSFDCVSSTVALLDALYVHLLLSSNQKCMKEFLKEHAEDWLHLLHQGLSSLPMEMVIYETNNASLHQTLLGKQHTISNRGNPPFGCHQCEKSREEDLFLQCMQYFPSDVAETIRMNQFTCASATTLLTPCSTVFSEETFTSLQPMLRSPLVVFDHNAENGGADNHHGQGSVGNMSVVEDYQWDLHRVVMCQSDVENASVAMDMSFVLAQMFS